MSTIAQASERWENQRLNFNVDLLKWTAHREFDVAYAVDEVDAIAACSAQFAVDYNAPHNLSSTLRCLSISADKSLYSVYRVHAEYGVPDGGEAPASADPLSQPPMMAWEPALQSVDFSHTIQGTPVQTAAGQPYDPPAQTDLPTMNLVYTRYQPFYDPAAATRLMGTMNKDNFVIKGKVMNAAVQPGQARVKNIVPIGEYSLQAYFVKVRWTFEIRPTFSATGPDGLSDAWDVREINKGSVGWFQPSTPAQSMTPDTEAPTPQMAPFYYVGEQPPTRVTEAIVYLDKTGLPLDTASFKVGHQLATPVANPTPMVEGPDFFWETLQAPSVPTGQIYVGHWRRLKPIPYANLL
ncbi:MAG TPA: hypothetical protein VK797_22725 [Tepidisphaeraceae bacterium]|jgi:hypothetical protein|nr:hypothetical protein [Tepidisphaeraceae bacterium]